MFIRNCSSLYDVKKPVKGPGPNIKNDVWRFKESVLSPSNRLSLNQRCFSKKIPLAQARRDYIENIIQDLSQHPLALYSHLEDALPPDVFILINSSFDLMIKFNFL